MRYFIKLSYRGTRYHGWQKQDNANSIQEVLENALSKKIREKILLTGAGRTDTGVHAKEMTAHFDVSQNIHDPNQLVYKLNSFLPYDIAIHTIFPVKDSAHARFDALSRTYEYWICQNKNVFLYDWSYPLCVSLNIEKMQQAAVILREYHDYTSFSKTGTQVKTNLCKIKEAQWEQKDDLLIFRIKADRFLRNMVRAIVGTLVEVGIEKTSLTELREIIQKKNRSSAGYSVPAKGLYLTKTDYPSTIYL